MGQPVVNESDPRAGRSERRVVNLHGFLALENGSASQVTVLDMSYEGCRIATSVELSEGQKVKLAVLRRGAIDATVRWAKDGQAGLVFAAVEAEPRPGHSPRRSARIELPGEVTLRRPGMHNFRVRGFDISPEGCKVEFVDRPEPGEQVWIKFDGLETLQAKVCWLEGTVSGLEFVRPIHPAVFELMIERLG